ncbi:MAG: isopentenyl-diphosphate Delta-isomerase [Frankiaceae bacterium]
MEEVVLLDESGRAIGTADKASVHGRRTPLHLAFSSYVLNGAGEVLVTRRSFGKATWPGAWTNSCCGHPAPGEPLPEAVVRRLRRELGLADVAAEGVELVLADFRYRAEMDNGVVENEICPVYRAVTAAEPVPLPDEVAEATWVPWRSFAADVLDGHREVSPWCRLQVARLVALGDDPLDWPVAEPSALPAAAGSDRRQPRP